MNNPTNTPAPARVHAVWVQRRRWYTDPTTNKPVAVDSMEPSEELKAYLQGEGPLVLALDRLKEVIQKNAGYFGLEKADAKFLGNDVLVGLLAEYLSHQIKKGQRAHSVSVQFDGTSARIEMAAPATPTTPFCWDTIPADLWRECLTHWCADAGLCVVPAWGSVDLAAPPQPQPGSEP